MYNVRRKLWGLTFIIFITAAVMLRFFPAPQVEQSVMAPSETAEQTQTDTGQSVMESGGSERFVAHRGYSGFAPENSAAAFEFAGKMGFWGIETDISETSDGAFICMHDETLDRTTDGEGAVGDNTLEMIEQYNIDSGNYLKTTENRSIPTFEEYLEICRIYDCVAVTEIKKINNYDAFLNIILNSGMENKCIITGPVEDLKEIRARNSVIPVMSIGYYPASYEDCLAQISEIPENRGVLYNYPQVEQYVVEELHSRGVYCAVWSIDDGELAQQYLDYGVDFVVTNELPARLTHMINENE